VDAEHIRDVDKIEGLKYWCKIAVIGGSHRKDLGVTKEMGD
jgi:hypothetical protein